ACQCVALAVAPKSITTLSSLLNPVFAMWRNCDAVWPTGSVPKSRLAGLTASTGPAVVDVQVTCASDELALVASYTINVPVVCPLPGTHSTVSEYGSAWLGHVHVVRPQNESFIDGSALTIIALPSCPVSAVTTVAVVVATLPV